ncbi:hypothetical protein ACFO9E_13215 [Streptomyces maoxianensis]|uniref:Uncharacterized protein n=1 Tax=Streptomyces maoxianensis TaxID=1459942 RepID=A0ABV9G5F9_9ACTN
MGNTSAFRLLLAVWVVTAGILVAVVAGAISDSSGGGGDWRGRLRSGGAAFGLTVASVVIILSVTGLTGSGT